LLVLGTSLEVWSGRAHQRGLPIVIVNHGGTRADHLATVCIDGNVGDVLRQLG
jgi:NAD-dependent SIR2 family protein deacetylase